MLIPTGKNINKLFSLSKDYIINNNKILIDEEKEFIQRKKDTYQLIQLYIKENLEKNKLTEMDKKEKKIY